MVEDDLFILPIETDFANLDIYNIGDVNLSHNVSIADVTNLRQYLAEMRELSAYQLSLSDAYYDTEVSIADAVRIQQYLADKTMLLGNRVNVTFLDKDQNPYRVKSVPFGGSLASIPELPEYSGYYGGVWSTDPQEIVYGLNRMQLVACFYFICGLMDTFSYTMRGLGMAVTPTIISLTGACIFRIVWIYTIFAAHHTQFMLYISYPISWALTVLAYVVCYLIIRKRKFITEPMATPIRR